MKNIRLFFQKVTPYVVASICLHAFIVILLINQKNHNLYINNSSYVNGETIYVDFLKYENQERENMSDKSENVTSPVNISAEEPLYSSEVKPSSAKADLQKYKVTNKQKNIMKEIKRINNDPQVNNEKLKGTSKNIINNEVLKTTILSTEVSKEENTKATYLSKLRIEIERNKHYPMLSRRKRNEGIVTVQFNISSQGEIGSPVILKSSGDNRLDEAGITAILNSNSVGVRPVDVASTVSVDITFKLR